MAVYKDDLSDVLEHFENTVREIGYVVDQIREYRFSDAEIDDIERDMLNLAEELEALL